MVTINVNEKQRQLCAVKKTVFFLINPMGILVGQIQYIYVMFQISITSQCTNVDYLRVKNGHRSTSILQNLASK